MKRYALYIVLLLNCISCQDRINLGGQRGESRLVVYAFPSDKDTIGIKVSVSRPINGRQTGLNVTDIRCTTNGVDDKIVHICDTVESGFPIAFYHAIGRHSQGDEVRILVEAGGLPSAVSSTLIPRSPVIDGRSEDSTSLKGDFYSRLTLSFRDNNDASFYAVRIKGRHVGEDAGVAPEEFLEVETSAEPLLNYYSSVSPDFGSWNDYYHHMYIFDDSSFRNASACLHLYVLQRAWIEAYRLQLFALSEEYYRMLKSLNDLKNNSLASYGLSFAYATYSNVQGGYGCVAGYTRVESEWLPDGKNTAGE